MSSNSGTHGLNRRSVAVGALWTAPVIAFGAFAPAIAASPVPGLNGWVLVRKNCSNASSIQLTINGNGDGTRYPVGQGYGLYVLNTTANSTVTGARITFYYPSDLGTLTWSAGSGTAGWSVPTIDGSAPAKSSFTAYTTTYSDSTGWTFNTGTPNYTIATGVPVFSASSSQTSYCSSSVTVWARRSVIVDGQTLTFERSVTI